MYKFLIALTLCIFGKLFSCEGEDFANNHNRIQDPINSNMDLWAKQKYVIPQMEHYFYNAEKCLQKHENEEAIEWFLKAEELFFGAFIRR